MQLLKATSALFARFPCAAFQICQLWHKQIPLRLPSLVRKLFSCKDQSTRTNPTYLHLMNIWVIPLVLFQHIICYIQLPCPSFKIHRPKTCGISDMISFIFTALLLRENHDFPSSGFQNKTSFLFETRQPRTHVRVLG